MNFLNIKTQNIVIIIQYLIKVISIKLIKYHKLDAKLNFTFLLRNTLYKSILRQDMAFFDKSSPGELSTILNGYNIDSC